MFLGRVSFLWGSNGPTQSNPCVFPCVFPCFSVGFLDLFGVVVFKAYLKTSLWSCLLHTSFEFWVPGRFILSYFIDGLGSRRDAVAGVVHDSLNFHILRMPAGLICTNAFIIDFLLLLFLHSSSLFFFVLPSLYFFVLVLFSSFIFFCFLTATSCVSPFFPFVHSFLPLLSFPFFSHKSVLPGLVFVVLQNEWLFCITKLFPASATVGFRSMPEPWNLDPAVVLQAGWILVSAPSGSRLPFQSSLPL